MENSLVTDDAILIKKIAIISMAIFLFLSPKTAQGEIEVNNTYIEKKQNIRVNDGNVAYTEIQNLVVDISFPDKYLNNMKAVSFESNFGNDFVAEVDDENEINYPVKNMGKPLTQKTNYQCDHACKMLVKYPYDEANIGNDISTSIRLNISIFDDIGVQLSRLALSSEVDSHGERISPIFKWVSFNHQDGVLTTKMSEISPVEKIDFEVIYQDTQGNHLETGVLSRGYYTTTVVPENVQKLMVKVTYQPSPQHQYRSDVILHDAHDPFFVDIDRRWGLILTKGLLHNDMGAPSL